MLGETIPAQVYFKIDEVAQENGQTRKVVSILCFDHGVKEFEVPAEIDGNPVVSVGTVNNGSWLPSPASDYLNAGRPSSSASPLRKTIKSNHWIPWVFAYN